MPASPTAAPTIVALDHLHSGLSVAERARASHFRANSSCSGLSHKGTDSLRHSVTCAECRKLSGTCRASAVHEEFKRKVIRSLTTARDRGAAVAPHVGRGRGLRVLGAGIDEHDGLAQPRAAVGHGSGRNVPDRGVFFVSCTSYGCNEPDSCV